MDTIEVVCVCGRVMKAPAQYAGRKGRCKGCGAVVEIPDQTVTLEPPDDGYAGNRDSTYDADLPAALVVDGEFVAAAISPDPPTPKPLPTLHTPPIPRPLPREPWYYGFIEVVALILLVFGGLGCVLGAVGGIVIVFLTSTAEQERLQSAQAVTLLMGSAAGAFTILVTTAPILLGVDLARNVRAMRYEGR